MDSLQGFNFGVFLYMNLASFFVANSNIYEHKFIFQTLFIFYLIIFFFHSYTCVFKSSCYAKQTNRYTQQKLPQKFSPFVQIYKATEAKQWKNSVIKHWQIANTH